MLPLQWALALMKWGFPCHVDPVNGTSYALMLGAEEYLMFIWSFPDLPLLDVDENYVWYNDVINHDTCLQNYVVLSSHLLLTSRGALVLFLDSVSLLLQDSYVAKLWVSAAMGVKLPPSAFENQNASVPPKPIRSESSSEFFFPLPYDTICSKLFNSDKKNFISRFQSKWTKGFYFVFLELINSCLRWVSNLIWNNI